jgi:glycosyltransferase involved in cell wall biosynthesis
VRVLILAQFYPPVIGGEERHVLSLSEGLVRRGHEVVVATMPHPSRPEKAELGGVAVQSVHGAFQRFSGLFSDRERPHAPPFPDPELCWRLADIVRAFQPDVVHGHNWMSRSYLPLNSPSTAAFIQTLHDYSHVCAVKTLTRRGENCAGPRTTACLSCASAHFGAVKGPVTATANFAFSRALYRSVDHFIAVSRAVAERGGLVGGPVPFDVVPNFIHDDTAEFPTLADERVSKLPPGRFLLFVGDLTRRKGVHILVEAYAKLRGAPPLVLIGRRCPDTPTFLPENVMIFESWPHPSVMYAWSKALFGIAPSTWVEPCASVFMEANAVGCPMVVSNHGGQSEGVEHGRTGLCVPPGDPDALAEAMQRMLDDEDLRTRLAAGALAKADSFKAHSIIPRIESIYRAACAQRAAGGRRVALASPAAEAASRK